MFLSRRWQLSFIAVPQPVFDQPTYVQSWPASTSTGTLNGTINCTNLNPNRKETWPYYARLACAPCMATHQTLKLVDISVNCKILAGWHLQFYYGLPRTRLSLGQIFGFLSSLSFHCTCHGQIHGGPYTICTRYVFRETHYCMHHSDTMYYIGLLRTYK